jgi:hypothetical protein
VAVQLAAVPLLIAVRRRAAPPRRQDRLAAGQPD